MTEVYITMVIVAGVFMLGSIITVAMYLDSGRHREFKRWLAQNAINEDMLRRRDLELRWEAKDDD